MDARDKRRKTVIYLAGPYRAKTRFGVLLNIIRAARVAMKYWRLGYTVICPHTNSAMFDLFTRLPDDVWLGGDLEILSRCDTIALMKNWKQSTGSVNEHDFALHHNIEIIYD